MNSMVRHGNIGATNASTQTTFSPINGGWENFPLINTILEEPSADRFARTARSFLEAMRASATTCPYPDRWSYPAWQRGMEISAKETEPIQATIFMIL